ncbi:glycosyltransferase family 4 protein [Paenibacillus pinistramenti]|uniref:glycosyltransferase family 4 protein n=1 Tax=Paenibacillus pinistramenti TaxID=1768003 RepID=UPI001107C809|nr:glycosyltransferase family 4 protein [Paenibacillus pinistramenti]
MRKNIWMLNHYAANMFRDQGGRHYWFAKNLIGQHACSPTIFCASTIHNSSDVIETGRKKYVTDTVDGIPFVFMRTPLYTGNGRSRIRNMISFYRSLYPAARAYARLNGKPDVILASSVHPLTLVAGIRLAKEFGVPCICEVRDLWPESLVAYGSLKRESLLAKLLYQGEKWIYKKADAVIMTWEGGKDYVIGRGWSRQVDPEKIKHINNGVDIELFDQNAAAYPDVDARLEDKRFTNIVYTGSIRKVNQVGLILDAAKIIQAQGAGELRFLIYGAGDETELLQKRCAEESISNVIFMGKVNKQSVPAILKSADINLLHYSSTSLDQYGQSQNKLFEYLAAGKCIVQTYSPGYSICDRNDCGISVANQTAEEIAKAILTAYQDKDRSWELGLNARRTAYQYDFKRLTQQLVSIIDEIDAKASGTGYGN